MLRTSRGGQDAARRKPGGGVHICPNCGGDQVAVDEVSGENVCKSCGLVLPSGAGASPEQGGGESVGSLGSSGLGYGADYAGRELAVRVKNRMRRLRGVERRAVVGGRERRELRTRGIVSTAVERLGLPPSYVDDAIELYRGASRAGAVAGRSSEVCVAASIYVVARQRGATRTMREVASSLGIDASELRRCYSSIVEGLGLRVSSNDPRLFVSKYAPALGVGGDVERRAIDVLLRTKGEGEIVGKNPVALAAAAVYLACRELGARVTQREAARTFGVSDVTLRNRLRDLERALGSKR